MIEQHVEAELANDPPNDLSGGDVCSGRLISGHRQDSVCIGDHRRPRDRR